MALVLSVATWVSAIVGRVNATSWQEAATFADLKANGAGVGGKIDGLPFACSTPPPDSPATVAQPTVALTLEGQPDARAVRVDQLSLTSPLFSAGQTCTFPGTQSQVALAVTFSNFQVDLPQVSGTLDPFSRFVHVPVSITEAFDYQIALNGIVLAEGPMSREQPMTYSVFIQDQFADPPSFDVGLVGAPGYEGLLPRIQGEFGGHAFDLGIFVSFAPTASFSASPSSSTTSTTTTVTTTSSTVTVGLPSTTAPGPSTTTSTFTSPAVTTTTGLVHESCTVTDRRSRKRLSVILNQVDRRVASAQRILQKRLGRTGADAACVDSLNRALQGARDHVPQLTP